MNKPLFKINQTVKNNKRKGIIKNIYWLYVPEIYKYSWVYHVCYPNGWDYTPEIYLRKPLTIFS